jgi:hypothetical protein
MLAEGWFPANNEFSAMVKTIADTLYIYGSAPVLAIMDAASIMHVGSIAGDEYLLVEARKRYSFAVHGLRLEAAHKESGTALSGVLILALGIMANHVMCPELHTTLTMRAFASSS